MLKRYTNYVPVSVSFSKVRPQGVESTNDLICTALARCAKKNKSIAIEIQKHRCRGGKYFVCGKNCPQKEIEHVYVEEEQVFSEKSDARKFLNQVGQCPVQGKYLIFEPGFSVRADVICFLCSPSQACQILGLGAKLGLLQADLVPAISTCATVFRSFLCPKKIHVNLIDTFDRNYQAKGFYQEGEIWVSFVPDLKNSLEGVMKNSPYGDFFPEKVDVYDVLPL